MERPPDGDRPRLVPDGLGRPRDPLDHDAIANRVAICLESADADLDNALDELARAVWSVRHAHRSARDAGWTTDAIAATVDTGTASSRLRALADLLARTRNRREESNPRRRQLHS